MEIALTPNIFPFSSLKEHTGKNLITQEVY
jgi:hypothetical protein